MCEAFLSIRPINQKKHYDVSALFEACNVEFLVVIFTDTWYTEDSENSLLPSYSDFYLICIGNRGGCVFIETMFTGFEIVFEYSQVTDNIETLCTNYGRELFAVIYGPPTGFIAALFRFIDCLFSYANDTGCLLVLGRDFNIDVSKYSGTKADFLAILECNGFYNEITLRTRGTSSTCSPLDMFIMNSSRDCNKSGVLSSGVSDNVPIFLFVDTRSTSQGAQTSKGSYRVIPQNTLNSFRNNIGCFETKKDANFLSCFC